MPEEKKVSKYEKLRDNMPASVLIKTGNSRGLLGVQASISRHKETKKEYRNITLRSGYEGGLGFVPNRVNSALDLPADLTDEQLKEIVAGIKKVRDSMPKSQNA